MLADAGLRAGDVVLAFDRVAVDGTMDDWLGCVRRTYLVGATVTINVLRDGQRFSLRWVLK